MRILIISPGRLPVPAVRGGAVETLIESLLRYNEIEKKSTIDVVSLYDNCARKRSEKYKYSNFIFIKMGRWFLAASNRHILPYKFLDSVFSIKAQWGIKKEKVDSYDCIVIENEAINGWILQKFLKGRYIFHAHNDSFSISGRKGAEFLFACNKIISISDFVAKKLRKAGRKEKVVTVYNGVDTELFNREKYRNDRVRIRKQLGINMDDIVIVYAGRLIPEKGIEELIKGFMFIPDNISAKLMITGSSFFESGVTTGFIKDLRRLCEEKRDKIIFCGYVEHENMPLYYNAADIGCVPSIWDEPFGLTVVEQMAMELPVIVTDSGAITEIVDQSCGIILERNEDLSCRIAQEIQTLCKDEQRRKNMGKAGRNRVYSRFSQNKFCENWFREIEAEE